MRGIQKCVFLLNLSTVSKGMGIFVKFWHARSLNMVMSRDSRCKFRLFVLILRLILRKVTKFPLGKLSTSEGISKEPPGGGGDWKTPPSVFRVKHLVTEDTLGITKHVH